MANELKHGTVGTELTQAEWEAIGAHILDAQAIGDLIYASTATQLRRLAIGSTGQPLTVVGGIPAWGGDVALGANKLTTTDLLLKQTSATRLGIKNVADTAYRDLESRNVLLSGAITPDGNYGQAVIDQGITTNWWVSFKAGNGSASVEVAALVGAANPYFRATVPMVLKPVATASLPATPVEGMLAYDDTVNKLKFYNGAAWETVTSA